jgi:microcystin-dependent protein/predicted  nucleic acid-binding Zn-ribbon protein
MPLLLPLRPLTCDELRNNFQAAINRAEHRGLQGADTIFDLYDTVQAYDFIRNLQTQVSTLNTELNQLRDDLFGEGELQQIINQVTQMIDDLTNNLESLITNLQVIEDLQTCCQTNTSAIAGLSALITSINSQLTASITQLQASINTINSTITTELRPRIVVLEADVLELQGDLSSAVARITVSEGAISTINTTINTELRPRIVTLETDLSALELTVGLFDGRITTVEGNIVTINNTINTDLRPRIVSLESFRSQLNALVSSIQSTITTLDNVVNNDVRPRLLALEDFQGDITADVIALQTSVSGLTSSLNSLTPRVTSLESRTALLETTRATISSPVFTGVPKTTWPVLDENMQIAPVGWVNESINNNVQSTRVPVGGVIIWMSAAIPQGWLALNGASVSRLTYPSLFAVLGYSVGGSGDTFVLPDLQGRFPLGSSGGYPIMAKGGAENVTLSTQHLPSHSHGLVDPGHTHTYFDPQHNHAIPDHRHNYTLANPGGGPNVRQSADGYGQDRGAQTVETGVQLPSNQNTNNRGVGITINGSSTGIAIQNTGNNEAHNNMPPYWAVQFIIRAL